MPIVGLPPGVSNRDHSDGSVFNLIDEGVKKPTKNGEAMILVESRKSRGMEFHEFENSFDFCFEPFGCLNAPLVVPCPRFDVFLNGGGMEDDLSHRIGPWLPS